LLEALTAERREKLLKLIERELNKELPKGQRVKLTDTFGGNIMAEERKKNLAWYISIWSDNRHEFGQPGRLGTNFEPTRSYFPDVVFQARGIAQAKAFIACLNKEEVPGKRREDGFLKYLCAYLEEAEKQ